MFVSARLIRQAQRPRLAHVTAAVRASPQARASYPALGEASRPCDPGARTCRSSMALEGALGTKAQLCATRHGLARARLPGRPRTVTAGDGLVGVTPGQVTPNAESARWNDVSITAVSVRRLYGSACGRCA